MSYIRVPSADKSVTLPSLPSDSVEKIILKTYWKSRRQLFSTLVLCLGTFSLGTVFGWGVGACDSLKKEHRVHFEDSVLYSVFTIGALVSGPLAGYLMKKFGRKFPTCAFGVAAVLGWFVIAMAKYASIESAPYLLYVGRFITGFSTAGCFTIAPVYVKEITDDAHRAVLSSMVTLGTVSGNFIGIVTGVYMGWFEFTLFCLVFPLALATLVLLLPESPAFLITNQKPEKAQKAFNWLNVGYEEDEKDRLFRRFERIVDLLSTATAMRMSARKRLEERKKLKFTSRPVLHPAIVCLILIILQQGSGVNVIMTYLLDILNTAGDHAITSALGAILVSTIFLVIVIFTTFTVDRFGRKPLLIGGSIVMSLTHLSSGVYFLLLDKNAKDIQLYSWLPLVCLNLSIGAYAIGLGSVAWLVSAEINHPDFMEISGTLTVSTYWLFAYLTIQLFPVTWKQLGLHTCFFLYGGCCLFSVFFVYFALIETKGKTQEEIMLHYKGPTFIEDDLGGEASLGSLKARKGRKSGISGRSRVSINSGDSALDLVTLVDVRDDGDKA